MMTMGRPVPDDASDQPVINEAFMAEWLKYGFAEMHIYMMKHAEFEKWCQRHPRQEESDNESSS